MYGMIHRAVREMVLDRAGKDVWAEIERAAGIAQSELISVEVYDDAVTLRLIECAANSSEIDLEQFLVDFGQYWIGYAGQSQFGSILHFTGDNLVTFLRNLDRLHGSVQSVMPKASMPSFKVVAEEPGRIEVDYISARIGLEPFVKGLMLGLLGRFDLSGDVALLSRGPTGSRFAVTFQAAPGS